MVRKRASMGGVGRALEKWNTFCSGIIETRASIFVEDGRMSAGGGRLRDKQQRCDRCE